MADQDHTNADEDAAFDRDLAEIFKTSEDEDVAELSRAVLSRLTTHNDVLGGHGAEVLSEPLPWALGFAGLMAIGVALGYLLSAYLAGDGVFAVLAFGDVFHLLGGM